MDAPAIKTALFSAAIVVQRHLGKLGHSRPLFAHSPPEQNQEHAPLNICAAELIRSGPVGTTAAPQKVRFPGEKPEFALFEDDSAFCRESGKSCSEGVVRPPAQPIHKSGHFTQVQGPNHHLDRPDLPWLHRQCP